MLDIWLCRVCSGRRSCDIPVPNGDLDGTRPCFKELKTYFEAGYKCVKGKAMLLVVMEPGD